MAEEKVPVMVLVEYTDAIEQCLGYVHGGVHGYLLSKMLRKLRPIREDYDRRQQALVLQYSRPVTDDDAEEIRKAGSRYIEPENRDTFIKQVNELNNLIETIALDRLPRSLIVEERIPGTLVDKLFDLIDMGEPA